MEGKPEKIHRRKKKKKKFRSRVIPAVRRGLIGQRPKNLSVTVTPPGRCHRRGISRRPMQPTKQPIRSSKIERHSPNADGPLDLIHPLMKTPRQPTRSLGHRSSLVLPPSPRPSTPPDTTPTASPRGRRRRARQPPPPRASIPRPSPRIPLLDRCFRPAASPNRRRDVCGSHLCICRRHVSPQRARPLSPSQARRLRAVSLFPA